MEDKELIDKLRKENEQLQIALRTFMIDVISYLSGTTNKEEVELDISHARRLLKRLS